MFMIMAMALMATGHEVAFIAQCMDCTIVLGCRDHQSYLADRQCECQRQCISPFEKVEYSNESMELLYTAETFSVLLAQCSLSVTACSRLKHKAHRQSVHVLRYVTCIEHFYVL